MTASVDLPEDTELHGVELPVVAVDCPSPSTSKVTSPVHEVSTISKCVAISVLEQLVDTSTAFVLKFYPLPQKSQMTSVFCLSRCCYL